MAAICCQGTLFASSILSPSPLPSTCYSFRQKILSLREKGLLFRSKIWKPCPTRRRLFSVSAAYSPLDLTEENVREVLLDARTEFAQIFDTSAGMTGKAELAEVDGPFVKISLSGRFWHKRSTVLARLGTYLKNRIPEILEVDIEDEKQLDDSPENF
ncbi:hypothetical protein H6P81_008842 [Aristolochia fimbriata]|uniref:Uncharacterized protein n=1 Tax=Aristolochia fimbriata TaxID=158543 RepID=A0AAV7EME9_ARIFI|nr:hypothetical protein H6P81_008842 [Aristolochia fimbriata]